MDRRGLVSSYDLAAALGVAQGTAWRLLSDSRVPRETTLEKIAAAFAVPLTEVRELAERPIGEPERFELPREFDQLSHRQRGLILEAGWAFIEATAGGRRVTR